MAKEKTNLESLCIIFQVAGTVLCLFYSFSAHIPDNSFLGFAVPRKSQDNPIRLRKPNDRMVALVYGKDPEFWRVSIAAILTDN